MKKNNLDHSKLSITKNKETDVNDPLEVYLKNEYGIDNVMTYEFDNLRNKDRSNFDVSQVRGSLMLKQGRIRTFAESEERFNKVAARLQKYKPN